MMLSSTFGFSMLQTWETVLVCECQSFLLQTILLVEGGANVRVSQDPAHIAVSLLFALTLLFWLSVFTLYPRYLAYLSRRFSYYVFEDESISVSGAVKAWLKDTLTRRSGGGGGDVAAAVSAAAADKARGSVVGEL
jgi:hypothetical protein